MVALPWNGVAQVRRLLRIVLIGGLLNSVPTAFADGFYDIVTLPVPDGLKLEVSGLATLPDGRLAAAIRKGEVWLVENPLDVSGESVRYHIFASGLHEPLGLAFHDDSLFVAQRAELTRLRDTDGDDLADEYLTVATGWGVTGNYHEYAYGPQFDDDGNMWMTLNATLGRGPYTDNAWRGWSIKIAPDGEWHPVSGGLRSPCGIGKSPDGAVFAADHQGNWVPTNALVHLRPGVFHGHADALAHTTRPGATFAHVGQVPQNIPYPEALQKIPALRPPAIWFPYRKMGQGVTDVLCDTTQGRFGPFAGQFFVGDFTTSAVFRVFLEQVNGEYQGACFPFLEGFQCAALRLEFASDGSLFVGETNRGWNSLGTRSYGLERVIWSGRTPFELLSMSARPDGFELEFTAAVDPATAARPGSYAMSSYTYLYRSAYGSPEIETAPLKIREARPSTDGRRVHLVVDGLREGYVHELHFDGVGGARGERLERRRAYYTLNRIPKG